VGGNPISFVDPTGREASAGGNAAQYDDTRTYWGRSDYRGVPELFGADGLMFVESGGVSGQAIWWGWNPGSSGLRSSQNHTTINAIPLSGIGTPFTWRARLDARPVLLVASDQSSIEVASERNGSGIMTASLFGPSDFTTAYVQRYGLSEGRAISANGSDKYPVIISYPSACGFPASTRIFFLAGGYQSGLRIAQYDYSTSSTSLVTGEYGEYTYYSLQGASNTSSASFVVVAEDYNWWSGYHNVCVFSKPTYYGNSLPSLNTVYTNMVQPAIMVQSGGFGSPTYEVDMKSGAGASWYKASGGSASFLGSSVAGIFARELVASGDRASMVVRTTTTPSRIEYYSGSGILQKTSASDIALNARAFRLWKDQNKKDRLLVLDFYDAKFAFLDMLENSKTICSAKLISPSSNGFSIAQVDSLAVKLGVEVIRDEKVISSYVPSRWNALSTNNVRELTSGDILRFSLKEPTNQAWGYTEYSIDKGALMKSDSVGAKQLATDNLTPVSQNIAVYPNPFNPSTTFRISTPSYERASLKVYNMLGQEIAVLFDGDLQAGEHVIPFSASNLPSGIYFYRIIVGETITSGRLSLLK